MGELTAALPNIDELKRVGIIGQKQKDYYLIRLRTIGGGMTSEELGVVSGVAEKYGKGRVHLTTRQAVEIHNIHVDNLQAAREELEQNGIVLGVCGPRGRGIVACPGELPPARRESLRPRNSPPNWMRRTCAYRPRTSARSASPAARTTAQSRLRTTSASWAAFCRDGTRRPA